MERFSLDDGRVSMPLDDFRDLVERAWMGASRGVPTARERELLEQAERTLEEAYRT